MREEGEDGAEPTRCGYVALIGAPNAGKSTLLNQLVGRKLAIVTPKVQTTRTRLLGIAIAGPAQLILVDTPGIFAPRRRLDRAMVAAAWAGAADADRVVLLVDAARPDDPDTQRIIEKAEGKRAPGGAGAQQGRSGPPRHAARHRRRAVRRRLFRRGVHDLRAERRRGRAPQAPPRRGDAAGSVAVSRGPAVRRARALARRRGHARTGLSAAA